MGLTILWSGLALLVTLPIIGSLWFVVQLWVGYLAGARIGVANQKLADWWIYPTIINACTGTLVEVAVVAAAYRRARRART
jgi:hypothetical protein